MQAPVDVSKTILSTERLILRPWMLSDAEDMFEYAKDPDVGPMAGWLPHKDIEESRRVIKGFIKGRFTFAIEFEGRVIGSIGIEPYDEVDCTEFVNTRARMLGFVLSRDYWGRGIMPEAAEEVIRYCFEEMRMDILLCGYYPRNSRSARVQEKCGFRHYKSTTHKTSYGKIEDAQLNILSRHRWEKEKA